MSIKTDRLGNIFVKEISEIIAEEVRNDAIKFVTINHVKVSSDLSYAKVYFTTLIDEEKDKIKKALNHSSNFIKNSLCNRVDIRKMPDLEFVYDESVSYGIKIEKIIDQINDGEKE